VTGCRVSQNACDLQVLAFGCEKDTKPTQRHFVIQSLGSVKVENHVGSIRDGDFKFDSGIGLNGHWIQRQIIFAAISRANLRCEYDGRGEKKRPALQNVSGGFQTSNLFSE
jgi:hypothetical protein